MTTRIRTACGVCEDHAEAVFRVEGLHCSDEVAILERRLKPLPGVETLAADVVSQRLRVAYDAARLAPAAMVDAAADAGLRMWLEHETPADAGAADARRAWFTLASGVALAVGLASDWAGVSSVPAVAYLAAVAAGVVAPARRAVAAVRARTLDINVLMVLAVAGALAIGEWAEAASVVFLFALSQWLEARTLQRARQAIRTLLDLAPREAVVRRGGHDERVPVEAVALGETVLVRPGDRVPIDGIVVGGSSEVDESTLTGESLPVAKAIDAEVFAGTVNGHGSLDVRVTRVGPDTRMARIISPGRGGAVAPGAATGVRRALRPVVHAAGRAGGADRGRGSAAGRRRSMGVDLPRAGAPGHRLPVRARDLDAGVDRRGALGRGAARRAGEGRHGARAAGHGGCGGVRQDGHPDARPDEPGRRPAAGRLDER